MAAAHSGTGSNTKELDHPDAPELIAALRRSFAAFPAPLKIWRDFFAAMRRDLTGIRFSTYDDFLAYTAGASGSPTTLYLYLLFGRETGNRFLPPSGFDVEACGQALGLFAYLGHILRDLPEDLEQLGAVYLAEDDMRRYGIQPLMLREGLEERCAKSPIRALVKELAIRARASLAEGRLRLSAAERNLTPDCSFILRLIVGIYEAVIDRIENCDFDPMQRRHYLSDAEKQAIAFRLMTS